MSRNGIFRDSAHVFFSEASEMSCRIAPWKGCSSWRSRQPSKRLAAGPIWSRNLEITVWGKRAIGPWGLTHDSLQGKWNEPLAPWAQPGKSGSRQGVVVRLEFGFFFFFGGGCLPKMSFGHVRRRPGLPGRCLYILFRLSGPPLGEEHAFPEWTDFQEVIPAPVLPWC